ncbi:DedA family protein [Myxococcota bacterium]|nr:DedA family protein [Myxococcota bacterium]
MEALLDLVRESSGIWALVAVFVAAALEYMIPPLPADSVVLAGSLLVVSGAWPLPIVFGAAVAGGFVGSAVHYSIGRALSTPDGGMRGQRWIEKLTGRGAIDRFFTVFRRYGVWVIALNRMMPGIRSVAFLAAGAARLPPLATLGLGLVSNLIWTSIILGLGISVGGNWEKISETFAVYSRGIMIVGAVLAFGVITFFVWRRRRRAVLGSAARDAE